MGRKTIKIELVIEDDMSQAKRRENILGSIASARSSFWSGEQCPEAWREVLQGMGWMGGDVAVTVSNPKRTSHWKV